jgi:hypothetical protein
VLGIVAVLRQENLRDAEGGGASLREEKPNLGQDSVLRIPGPGMKKRGRPRKSISLHVEHEAQK